MGFSFNNNVPLVGKNLQTSYTNGWFGGMNAPQVQQTDINNDGSLDLIILDRAGDKLSAFESLDNRLTWTYNPNLIQGLPKIDDWFIVRDYNNDGLDDFFVSAGNGIRVYKRLPSNGNLPVFELVTDLLLSEYFGNDLNLFVSRVDIPAIDDIDGDGDLDILTFYILGTCVEYHKNLSQELHGNNEHLIFKLESDNWGRFTEDAQTNAINYNDSCGRAADGERHSGSTLLIDNLDQDNDVDLMLGDISYAEALFLINQPIESIDVIVPTPQNYPLVWNNISVPVFPGLFKVQTNNDQLPDLVVAPNTESEAINSGRLMKRYNTVTGSSFRYTGSETPFLCHEMLDLGKNSIPFLADLDNDGDQDLLVGTGGEYELPVPPLTSGNYRSALWLFENIGTLENPSFIYRDDDVAELKSLNLKHLSPTASDLNGDGKVDIVVGLLNGKFRQLNNVSENGNFNFELTTETTISSDAGESSAPGFFDANEDGIIDLISGSREGNIKVFLNSGSNSNPIFASAPDINQWGNVETVQEGVSNNGFSNPAVTNFLGQNYLLCGTERGTIQSWQITEGNFISLDSVVSNIDEGKLSGITIGSLNNDQYPDMITGNSRGGLNLYLGGEPVSIEKLNAELPLEIYPNPAKNQVYLFFKTANTATKDIFIFDIRGNLVIYDSSKEKAGVEINLSGLSNGIYILQVLDNGASSHAKLVISR
jgi:hypothetical protein